MEKLLARGVLYGEPWFFDLNLHKYVFFDQIVSTTEFETFCSGFSRLVQTKS